jgi:hypothetical protein
VNIDLDSKRNVLIEIMLVTAFVMFAVLCYTTETGLFGARTRGRAGLRRRSAARALTVLRAWSACSHDAAQRGGQGHARHQGGACGAPRAAMCVQRCCVCAERRCAGLSQPFYAVNVVSTVAVVASSLAFVAILRRRRILHI